jgi:hypothetical protein
MTYMLFLLNCRDSIFINPNIFQTQETAHHSFSETAAKKKKKCWLLSRVNSSYNPSLAQQDFDKIFLFVSAFQKYF